MSVGRWYMETRRIRIVALDLALTCVGWATYDVERGTSPSHESGTAWLPPTLEFGHLKTKGRGLERIEQVVDYVEELVTPETTLVVIEGYSYGSGGGKRRTSSLVDLGELGGIIRWTLWISGHTWVEIAPSSRAMYATGNGGAGKAQVLADAIRRLHYDGHVDDEADALWLLQMALGRYALPGAVELPKKHTRAQEKVEWPEIPGLE